MNKRISAVKQLKGEICEDLWWTQYTVCQKLKKLTWTHTYFAMFPLKLFKTG